MNRSRRALTRSREDVVGSDERSRSGRAYRGTRPRGERRGEEGVAGAFGGRNVNEGPTGGALGGGHDATMARDRGNTVGDGDGDAGPGIDLGLEEEQESEE